MITEQQQPFTVVTAVAPENTPLTHEMVDAIGQKIVAVAAAPIDPVWLHPGRAVDFRIGVSAPALLPALRAALAEMSMAVDFPVDFFVQATGGHNAPRRKKMLVSDMDSTAIEGEMIDDLARHLGIGDKIADITARGMRGDIGFHESLISRIELLKDLPVEVFMAEVYKIKPSRGITAVVRTMQRAGAACVLVSGGFTQATAHVAAVVGFNRHHGNILELDNAGVKLTGRVFMPILDAARKRAILEDECRRTGISPADVIAVGDGSNDVDMVAAAGTGVAYHGRPKLLAATPHHIRHTTLVSLLYMQGYTQAEILA